MLTFLEMTFFTAFGRLRDWKVDFLRRIAAEPTFLGARAVDFLFCAGRLNLFFAIGFDFLLDFFIESRAIE